MQRILVFCLLMVWAYRLEMPAPPMYEPRPDKVGEAGALGQYAEIFGKDYHDALQYMQRKQPLIRWVWQPYGTDAAIMLPVVFPERIRYSIVHDFFETRFLETVYTRYGPKYADFSIGDFQMKPSFVVQLEQKLRQDSGLRHKYPRLAMPPDSSPDSRKERVRRLKSTEYQLRYLALFYDIVRKTYPLRQWDTLEQIRILAAAYNTGFSLPIEKIRAACDFRYFPYGTNHRGKQYAYTDVATDFYQHYIPYFFTLNP